MKILVYTIFIGIALVVFYLYLRKLFGERSCKVPNLREEEKIKPPLPKEKSVEDQRQKKDNEPEDTFSEEAKPLLVYTKEDEKNTEQTPSEDTAVLNQDLEENQD